MAKISIENLADEISKELTVFSKDIFNGIKKETNKAASQLVKQTKATVQVGKRRKHYRDNISSKTLQISEFAYSKLWYVQGKDARLTHLLNDGHALKDGGRYAGNQFLTKASEEVLNDYEQKVEEVCRNGR